MISDIIPTQEDQNAAAECAHLYSMAVLGGTGGGDKVLVQAFARHRLAAEARIQSQTVSQDQVERMREVGPRLCAVDRALARCLDLLGHIRGTGLYPPADDTEALAELDEHIASGDRARAALSPSGSMNDVGEGE